MSDRNDAVQAAIQLEVDGREFYLEAAEDASSDLTRRMFESLAADELRHKEWIETLSPGVDTAASSNRSLYERLRPVFAGMPEGTRLKAILSRDDVKAMEMAIEIENRSIAAYEQWAAEDDSPEIAGLCKVLAGQERFHRQVLENTREYLDRTPDWFMQEEQWNFEGA